MDAIISIVKSWRFWFIDKQLKMNKKGGFFSMLLGTLRASLFGNLSASIGVIRPSKGTFRASQEFQYNLIL